MIDSAVFLAAGVGCLVTFLVSVFLVLTKPFHGVFTLDHTDGVQKVHNAPTPRVGGLALAAGFFATWFFLDGEIRDVWGLVGLTGGPALAFGLAEDITRKVSVRARLMATIASGLIFALMSGYTITRVDLWGFDTLLTLPLVSLFFTAFAIGGAANSINIIDGFHGLAAGTLIIILGAFSLVAARVGDVTLVSLSLLTTAIVVGFFVVNFPLGKLFLGDSGAYFAGFLVATIAVMLPARNADVSPWVSLLILGYPVTETGVSMVRRLRRKGHGTGQADSLHLHHFVYRIWAKNAARLLRTPQSNNSLTSPFMWSLSLAALILANLSSLQTPVSIISLTALVMIYLTFYRRAVTLEAGVQDPPSYQ